MWWYYGIYIYIQGVSGGNVNILCGGIMECIYIQGFSGGVVNILCGGIMEFIYTYRVFQEE